MEHEASPPLLTIEDLRSIARWAADCAERALPVFEAKAPADTRPREAIAAARHFAQSGLRTSALRKVAWAALKAAQELADPAASAAARAASTAAGAAYTHPIATPHQINHILGPAAYAAQAIVLSAEDTASVRDAEIRWAVEHTSLEVRAVVQKLPGRSPSKTPLGKLLYQLDVELLYQLDVELRR